MAELFTGENLAALLTLTLLEIVLGIDNIVFLSILTGKLPEKKRPQARFIGLSLALGARIALLLGITYVMGLTKNLFSVFGHGVSGKDLILVGGGLFLLAKSTHEIHAKLERASGSAAPERESFASVIVQIVILDLIFSLDSIITAVGMARAVPVMIAAVVIAVGVMMIFAGKIGEFVERHPSVKMLALSFLLLIGVVLVAEGIGEHINRGYIYFAMAFAFFVELLNMRTRRK